MSSLFANLRVYAEKWQLKSCVPMDAEDKALFSGAKIVDSQYGKSVCLFLKNGGQNFIPVSNNSIEVNIGDTVNLDKVEIETLGRSGEADIYRLKING